MNELNLNLSVKREKFELSVTEKLNLENGIFAIVGKSGSGKTSILRAIAGLDKEISGQVIFGNHVWQDDEKKIYIEPYERNARMVFQENNLFSHLTVYDNLMFGLRRLKKKMSIIEFENLVNELSLSLLLDRFPRNLSGGEKQCVALGRAILSNPGLLLLDEPVNSLDSQRKNNVLDFISHIHKSLKIPVIIVSHMFSDISKIASNILIIDNGNIINSGPISDVISDESLFNISDNFEPFSLIGAKVLSHDSNYGLTTVNVEESNIQIPIIDADIGSQIRLRIFSSDVALSIKKPDSISIRNVIKSKILSVKKSGNSFIYISLTLGNQELVSRITRKSFEELKLSIDSSVYILIKSAVIDKSKNSKL